MAQRDYLMQQLEEMGYFLSGLLRRFLKLKEENREEEITSVLRDSLQEKLSFSIDEAIVLKDDDFLKLIKEQVKTENHLETMAELLLVTGKSIHSFVSPVRLSYLQKSLLLYTHLQETSTSFSFERKDKILEIQQILRS
ncbi:MAG: hypothetical protein K0M40_21645 [Prolixibacteraceae bacterium]|nr:hypothetical protein [Prolixibacteraceae bacterium]